jgi:uncharacterized protein (TIGR03435 family)
MSPIAVPTPINRPLVEEIERIYREHAPLIFRTAWGVLGSREDAEDVLQAIFLALMRRQSPPDLRQNPKAYFYRAAVTASLDVLKAKRRRPVLVNGPNLVFVAGEAPFSGLAQELGPRLGRVQVFDRTDLTGQYNWILEFAEDQNLAGAIGVPPPATVPTDVPRGATIFVALEEQLGLRLEPAQAPRDFIVIDRVERPMPD